MKEREKTFDVLVRRYAKYRVDAFLILVLEVYDITGQDQIGKFLLKE